MFGKSYKSIGGSVYLIRGTETVQTIFGMLAFHVDPLTEKGIKKVPRTNPQHVIGSVSICILVSQGKIVGFLGLGKRLNKLLFSN